MQYVLRVPSRWTNTGNVHPGVWQVRPDKTRFQLAWATEETHSIDHLKRLAGVGPNERPQGFEDSPERGHCLLRAVRIPDHNTGAL